ncbi:hypothetical protein IAR50_001752 [Cryptococcus sp. DSM 104548]
MPPELPRYPSASSAHPSPRNLTHTFSFSKGRLLAADAVALLLADSSPLASSTRSLQALVGWGMSVWVLSGLVWRQVKARLLDRAEANHWPCWGKYTPEAAWAAMAKVGARKGYGVT